MTTNWRIGDFLPYQRRNRWEIHKILGGPGRSGMGIVYVVYDHELREAFAAKTFQEEVFVRSPGIAARFRQEALAWINLDVHQNIAQARFVVEILGKPYLFLEYVSGGDLSAWIGTPRLTENLPQVLRFAVQFCDGMNHVLSKGIAAHRDIKPQNCLITENRALKVTDFGLAKVFEDIGFEGPGGRNRNQDLPIGLSRTGAAAGTPHYMAPEQFDDAKHVDVRADVYSFGVMLFEMVTGTMPFTGKAWKEFEHLHKAQLPPSVGGPESKVLDSILQKCMAKTPGHRFANFEVVRERLAELYQRLTREALAKPVGAERLDAWQWINKGESLQALGQGEDALSCYDRALGLDPRLALAWSNKGKALGALGRAEEALTCCDRALDLDPDFAMALNNQAAALGALGRWTEALTRCDRALDLDPRVALAWYNKALALGALRREEEALSCYDRALDLDPRDPLAWYNKAVALAALGRMEGALACYNRALDLDPRHALAWNAKAGALEALGRGEESLACYDRALDLDARYAQAWYNKGVVLANSGSPAKAIVCLAEAQRLGQPEAARAIAVCRRMLGE